MRTVLKASKWLGGLAVLFERHTDVFDCVEPDLTIQGLAMMYARAHIDA